MAKKEDTKDLTGLSEVTNKQDAEYDLLTGLLAAADFRNTEEKEVEIKRNGKLLFTLHIKPVSDLEARKARKNATTYTKNPAGKKFPPIEKEFNTSLFNSWLIYIATRDDDKELIWGNKTIMEKFNILQPVETVDVLLMAGEKTELSDLIATISGMRDEDEEGEGEEYVTPEDYAKN